MSPARESNGRARDPAATPRLRSLLARLRRRLVALIAFHGLGTLLAALALALELLFWLDWGLRVPPPVRWMSAALALAALLALGLRSLARPLAALPRWSGLAALFERSRPELGELYSAALSLQAPPAGLSAGTSVGTRAGGSPELIARVLEAAEQSAAGARVSGVLVPVGPARRLTLGLLLGGAVLAHYAAAPELGATFLARLRGANAAWPQRTQLELEVAAARDLHVLSRDPELLRLRAARGSELSVIARAHGRVPSDVRIAFDDGEGAPMPAVGTREFRFRLPAVQRDLAFWVIGGDDQDGLPRVELEVVSPPDVAGLAIAVQPPAYTGQPAAILRDRDVRVPEGSQLVVHVLAEPAGATGRARVLPEDRVIELVATPFPPQPPVPARDEGPSGESIGGESGAAAVGLSFALAPVSSIRYRIELTDESGLPNPDPGLYAVEVVPDRAPEVTLLAPSRTAAEITPNGALPLCVRAEDDYGLAELVWRSSRVGGEGVVERRLELPRGEADGDGDRSAPRRVALATRIEAGELGPATVAPATERTDEPAIDKNADESAGAEGASGGGASGGSIGSEYEIEVEARDARAAGPLAGRTAPIRVRVVTPDELLRRLQDRLARARTRAQALWELQRDTRLRTSSLAQALGGDAPVGAADELALETCLAGQRRVQGDAASLARDLTGVAESALYARLDTRAGALLEQIDAALAAAPEAGISAETWRAAAGAARARAGEQAGLAAHLLALVEIGLDVSVDLAPRASAAVDRARSAGALAAVAPALAEAGDAQAAVLERLESLLESLAEWDNYQSVLTLSRDLLERQRSLRDRTRAAASGSAEDRK